jgi:hypothetical protein
VPSVHERNGFWLKDAAMLIRAVAQVRDEKARHVCASGEEEARRCEMEVVWRQFPILAIDKLVRDREIIGNTRCHGTASLPSGSKTSART